MIGDIMLKANIDTDNVAIIATGLPTPVVGSFHTTVSSYDESGTNTIGLRVAINPSGQLLPWYMPRATSRIWMNFSITYITS